ncbi:MAG: GNAT family N-acetyltransferase [Gemmatimonadaceae bacterium]|nr:GNAT family N-acetyltransferase [Gemmatimonadaceae bacterium]
MLSLTLTIRRAIPSDSAQLAAVAERTFVETFAMDNSAADMAAYCGSAFGETIQREELENPRNDIFLAEREGTIAGYAMLRSGPARPVLGIAEPIEIARLYVTRAMIGTGVGAALMQHCLDEAAAMGKDTVWLGVWEHNTLALGFYTRWGFVDVGTYEFILGRDHQTDRLMARRVSGEPL